MIDFASLFWFAFYGAAFLLIALVLRQIARWSGGTSLADAFGGGYRDAPWPKGVQEEEPVRWRIEALQPRDRHPQTAVTCRGRERPRAAVPATRPHQAVQPGG